MKTVEKRRMCPNCRAFITIKDRVCPYCGVQLGPRAIDMRATRFTSSLLPRANLTGAIFITINIVFFLIELAVNYSVFHASPLKLSPYVPLLLGDENPQLIVQFHQWWRLITAGFLHAGFLHIGFNMWALFDLAGEVEQFYGTSRLIVTYIFSTFIGFLFALYFSGAGALGASAACFGLIGIMLAMGLRRSDPISQAVRSFYTRWLIYGIALSFLPGISLAAHLGGLAGGFVIGLLGGLPGIPNSPREVLWKVLAALAIIVAVYAFLQDFASYRILIQQIR
ncbi:MAG TPA: rhomboid family intramembrane serine protease [Bryobacteraceae bacterium]